VTRGLSRPRRGSLAPPQGFAEDLGPDGAVDSATAALKADGVLEEAAASPSSRRAGSHSRKASLPVTLLPAPTVGMADTSATARPPDMARLAALAQPRKTIEEEAEPQSCSPRRAPVKKKRSKCRILSLVQEKREQSVDVDSTLDSANELDDVVGGPAGQIEQESGPDVCALGANLDKLVNGGPFVGEARKATKKRTARARSLSTTLEASGETQQRESEAETVLLASMQLQTHATLKASASRRPRVSVSLPRAAAFVPRKDVTIAGMPASDAPVWRAVPIKTMQLDIGL